MSSAAPYVVKLFPSDKLTLTMTTRRWFRRQSHEVTVSFPDLPTEGITVSVSGQYRSRDHVIPIWEDDTQ